MHEHAFSSLLSHLKSLDLAHNKIENPSFCARNIFGGLSLLTNLEFLNLTDNRLSFIPDYAFSNYIGPHSDLSIVSFSLNLIRTIGQYSFYNLPSLRSLALSRNPIEGVER